MADGDTIYVGTALEGNQYADDTLEQYEDFSDSSEDDVDLIDYEEEVDNPEEEEYEIVDDYDDDYDEDEEYEESEDDYEGYDEEDEEDEGDDGYQELESLVIDGQEYSIEEVMEWQKGNLRQADYTRKTQELAREREELKELRELRDYLRSNPQLVQSLEMGNTVYDSNLYGMVGSQQNDLNKDLLYQVKSLQVDRQLDELKSKYGDIDEVALFEKATEMKTENLEEAYKVLAFNGASSFSDEDIQEIYNVAYADILEELNKNKSAVRTSVSSRQRPRESRPQLTRDEIRAAEAFGMTPSEYLKWR